MPRSPSASPRAPAPVPDAARCPALLVAARKGGTAADRYVVPTMAQRSAMTAVFAQLLSRHPPAIPPELGRTIEFRLDDVREFPGVFALHEAPNLRKGGGAYLVRSPSSSTLLIQAPHTFFDEGTLPVACDLFERASARALFIETAHRYRAAEQDESGAYPADLAHAPDSLFQAATEGFLSATAGTTIVQLHGFSTRETGADVVLSSGVARSDPLIDRLQVSLSAVAHSVLRFPQETKELGATTNVQGKLAREKGAKFVHVEMSSELRTKLVDDGAYRKRFLEALIQGLQTP